MRIIVCGSRKYGDSGRISMVLEEYAASRPRIIVGGASGADRLAEEAADEMGFAVTVIPAAWETLGKAAGPVRNQRMVDSIADLLIAFGNGRGTEDCIRRAERAGIPVRREP